MGKNSLLYLLILLEGLHSAKSLQTSHQQSEPEPEWRQVLENEGFVVQKGVHTFFDLEACKAQAKATCNGNNPLTPYGMAMMPRAPGELEMGYTGWCANHYTGCEYTLNEDGNPVSWNWRVKKGEVFLFEGMTPPESTYFSWTPYLYSRYHPAGWHSGLNLRNDGLMNVFMQCFPNMLHGKRCDSYVAINDPINHLDLKTQNSQSENKFNSKFAMMLSWDSESEKRVHGLMPGPLKDNMNFLRFPGKWAKMGVTTGHEDDFTMMYRVEGVHDAEAAKAYFRGNAPISVYRITPKEINLTAVNGALYPSFEGKLKTRWTGKNESAPGVTHQELVASLKELEKRVRVAHTKGTVETEVSRFFVPVNNTGYHMADQGGKGLGEHSDSLFGIGTMMEKDDFCKVLPVPFYCLKKTTSSKLTQDPNDALILVGVNHKAAGFALYSSITMYNFPKMGSIKALSNEMMPGSATKYLNESDPAAPYLFVHKFARSCRENDLPYCTEVPWKSEDPAQLNAALDDQLWFMERLYLRQNPSTGTSPIPEETIQSLVIHVADNGRHAKHSATVAPANLPPLRLGAQRLKELQLEGDHPRNSRLHSQLGLEF